MKIHVTTGKGSGPTELSAFDAALVDAGIANYNLLTLSSVIPPSSEIIETEKPIKNLPGEWGDRLYVVMAEKRTSTPNMEAWAGVGWVQEKETGRGLFVEHEANSQHAVRQDIKDSLHALMALRNVDFGEIHMVLSGRTCHHDPVCAMAVAVYQVSDWENKPMILKE